MLKGQFPKLKGMICNIPIQTESVCDTLPRLISDSNILFIKLKKKLRFRSHVFSEAVRCDFIFQLLDYLKSVNPLYKYVNIRQFCESTNNNDVELDFIDENQVDFIVPNQENPS